MNGRLKSSSEPCDLSTHSAPSTSRRVLRPDSWRSLWFLLSMVPPVGSMFAALQAQDPVLESGEQVGEKFARGFVGEPPLGVDLGRDHADEYLGPRQRGRPELH